MLSTEECLCLPLVPTALESLKLAGEPVPSDSPLLNFQKLTPPPAGAVVSAQHPTLADCEQLLKQLEQSSSTLPACKQLKVRVNTSLHKCPSYFIISMQQVCFAGASFFHPYRTHGGCSAESLVLCFSNPLSLHLRCLSFPVKNASPSQRFCSVEIHRSYSLTI